MIHYDLSGSSGLRRRCCRDNRDPLCCSVSGGPWAIVRIFAAIVVLKDGAVISLLDLRFKIVIYNFIDCRRH